MWDHRWLLAEDLLIPYEDPGTGQLDEVWADETERRDTCVKRHQL